MAGDRMAIAKGIPNGEVGKIGSSPKAGPSGLDKARFGSARNTAKDYTNPKKVVSALKK